MVDEGVSIQKTPRRRKKKSAIATVATDKHVPPIIQQASIANGKSEKDNISVTEKTQETVKEKRKFPKNKVWFFLSLIKSLLSE